VFGLEADLNGGRQSRTFTDGVDTVTLSSNYLGTLRLRAGLASGPALFYATGGLAFTSLKGEVEGEGSDSKSKTGWVLGGGIEYAFSTNWTARLQALHHRFNFDLDDVDAKYTVNTVTVGLSYKF
jgi:outer membrane immunogenic protein